MELKLKLVKDDVLSSAIGELSSFSEMGECQLLPLVKKVPGCGGESTADLCPKQHDKMLFDTY